MTKDELRAELERQEQRFKDVYGGEITTYAAQPEPERKPWRKKASLLDQAFKQELQKMEKDLSEEIRSPRCQNGTTGLRLQAPPIQVFAAVSCCAPTL